MAIDKPLAEWCESTLGSRPREMLFAVEHLSRVIGLKLEDGREVVVKMRPYLERFEACTRVQRHLAGAGFPCPMPLVGPLRIGNESWSAEEYVGGGAFLAPGPDSPRLMAELLRQIVALSPAAEDLPSLAPNPPWLDWKHSNTGPWPTPDDLDLDMNVHPGPAWLDDLAARLRVRLDSHHLPHVVGHGDWELQNLRWIGRVPHVVHDWDSVVSLPEAVIAGSASTIFVTTPDQPMPATLAESAAFIDAYGLARVGWSQEESEVAWAAGLWTLAFDAKKAAIRGNQPSRIAMLETELANRSARAGL